MAGLALREAGWDAENFGVNIPVDSYCAALRKHKPRLLWISVSHIADEAAFVTGASKLCAAAREIGTAVAMGGRGLTPALRQQIHYNAFCESFRELAAFAEALQPEKP